MVVNYLFHFTVAFNFTTNLFNVFDGYYLLFIYKQFKEMLN
ncbi:hypothetical protein Cst_c01950 [Thermoclostridium stercorarium subsp. stercorarium DSM 8532]|uniref:Uncharacterized protein n=1 Tax=Thermoclostridium stercorarium (strain ATCC 35414 / DSM 8532 / NCIMB 11754) TaxID=1121335 RepID=L7VGX1_THES1|nr:hypothetical protein Cst_c01950 [Thermoclostridium stercorarium subsp. stercorarium DSM 8532]